MEHSFPPAFPLCLSSPCLTPPALSSAFQPLGASHRDPCPLSLCCSSNFKRSLQEKKLHGYFCFHKICSMQRDNKIKKDTFRCCPVHIREEPSDGNEQKMCQSFHASCFPERRELTSCPIAGSHSREDTKENINSKPFRWNYFERNQN